MNKVIREQGEDINLLTDILKKQVDSYRLLIASAAELNNIYEARSSQVKTAIKRAESVGHIIDHLVDIIDDCGDSYFQYVKLKGDAIHSKGSSNLIITEVTNDLGLQNSNIRLEEDEDDDY